MTIGQQLRQLGQKKASQRDSSVFCSLAKGVTRSKSKIQLRPSAGKNIKETSMMPRDEEEDITVDTVNINHKGIPNLAAFRIPFTVLGSCLRCVGER